MSETCREAVMQFKIEYNKNIYTNKRLGRLGGGSKNRGITIFPEMT